MASEERKAADSKIMADNLFNSLGAEEPQAETDAFQCGRCKQASLLSLNVSLYFAYRGIRENADIGRHKPGAPTSL
jgi:hypothetical protein